VDLDIRDELYRIIEIGKQNGGDATCELIGILNEIFFKMRAHQKKASERIGIEYEMKDLRDKISYLRAQLSHYEKTIIDNKENMKNMDKRNIELEYELQDYEAKVSEALYRLRNAQRKAMQDYFVKCFPLKTGEVKTSNNVSYSPSNPYVYFGTDGNANMCQCKRTGV
jgi:hypothetical protein